MKKTDKKTKKATARKQARNTSAKHVEMDSLIEENAHDALRIACVSLDYSLELFFRLIEKKALCIPVDTDDDTIYEQFSHDRAAACLKDRLWKIRERVSQFALAGHSDMIHVAWVLSYDFAVTIHDMALVRPESLEWLTKNSLCMPSLRALRKNFSYDFPAIAKATRLSEECEIDTRSGAKYRLESPATRHVADIIQVINFTISGLKLHKECYETLHKVGVAIQGNVELQKFADMTLEEWLIDHKHMKSYQIHYDELPPLRKSSVSEWWVKAIKGEVENRFDRIKGTKLYDELANATEDKKDYHVLDEWKRRCKQALNSLAPRD